MKQSIKFEQNIILSLIRSYIRGYKYKPASVEILSVFDWTHSMSAAKMFKKKLDTVKYYGMLSLIVINIPIILILVGIATVIKFVFSKQKLKDITDKVVMVSLVTKGRKSFQSFLIIRR